MSTELNYLKTLVKTSSKPVNKVVEDYFKTVVWSLLKSEYRQMGRKEREMFHNRLEQERK